MPLVASNVDHSFSVSFSLFFELLVVFRTVVALLLLIDYLAIAGVD